MPKLTNRPPKMSKKPDGQAYVTINGKRIYLGKYGSPEAMKSYNALISEMANVHVVSPSRQKKVLLVSELFVGYQRYLTEEKPESGDLSILGTIFDVVNPLYGEEPIDSFRAVALRNIQKIFTLRTYKRGKSERLYSRRQINDMIRLVIRMFKWGVSREIVSPETWQILMSVEPVKPGKARETEPRKNVPSEVVKKTLPYLSSVVAGIIRFQLATACRPSEACMVRKCDIFEVGGVRVYRPESHKNKWRGQSRNIIINKEAFELVELFGRDKGDEEYIFQPKDACEERWERLSVQRKSKVSPSQVRRHERVMEHGRYHGGSKYNKDTYNRAVHRAVERANKNGENLPDWTPYQLRHEAITQYRLKFGAEVAQAVAGHRSLDTTEIYSHCQIEMASRILEE